MYLVAKPSAHTLSPRQILTVWTYLATAHKTSKTLHDLSNPKAPLAWHLPASEYEQKRSTLYTIEANILRALGFKTSVALPHTLCLNYLQTLGAFQDDHSQGSLVAKRAFMHLNTALQSPQLLYLTFQPSALAAAAIYLAAREVGVKLPACEWWEVFDVGREELGFLVVGFGSVEGFAEEIGGVSLTVRGIREECERRRTIEDGE